MSEDPFNLDEQLKAARVPERCPGYWEQFPARVTARLRHETREPERVSPRPLMAVFAVVVAALALWAHQHSTTRTSDERISQYQKLFREVVALFPNQVKAIIVEKDEVRLQLADCQVVPSSQPVLVRISDKKQNRDFITFSGQQIRVDDQDVDVLVDGAGELLLVGKHFCWSKSQGKGIGDHQVQAQLL